MPTNIVELMADPDESDFDQPCRFGHRVEGHAVYCHHDAWADGPRKCRRTWYTGGEVKDEDCPGFEPNPEFAGDLNPSPIEGEVCTRCAGARIVAADGARKETCPHCMGHGSEPAAMLLSAYEQDTLEMGCGFGADKSGGFEAFVRIAERADQSEAVARLRDLGLVRMRSMSFAAGATVFLLYLTGRGAAVMRANWRAKGS